MAKVMQSINLNCLSLKPVNEAWKLLFVSHHQHGSSVIRLISACLDVT